MLSNFNNFEYRLGFFFVKKEVTELFTPHLLMSVLFHCVPLLLLILWPFLSLFHSSCSPWMWKLSIKYDYTVMFWQWFLYCIYIGSYTVQPSKLGPLLNSQNSPERIAVFENSGNWSPHGDFCASDTFLNKRVYKIKSNNFLTIYSETAHVSVQF